MPKDIINIIILGQEEEEEYKEEEEEERVSWDEPKVASWSSKV